MSSALEGLTTAEVKIRADPDGRRSNASFCYDSLVATAGSIPADGMDVCLFRVLSGRSL